MAPKVLFVLTSQEKIPSTDAPTGWYLPEFAHPYEVLKEKTEITIASPNGGAAPLDPASVSMFAEDPVSAAFLKQEQLWSNTVKLSDVKADDFDAIFYVGGHGPMFDLPNNADSQALIQSFAEAKKLVSAVCHGPSAFLHAKTAAGKPILEGTTMTGLSNVEEEAVKMTSHMPFALETELNKISNGGFKSADEPWGENVVVSQISTGAPLITGQNPRSATAVGKAILKALGL